MTASLPLWWHFSIYSWHDVLEIMLISSCVYYFSVWLYADQQKSLLVPFYGYCLALIGTHFLQLSVCNSLLLIFTPVACMVFFVIHQNTLQKNFITLHRITPTAESTGDYLEDLLRAALMHMSNNQPFSCIIEKQQALDPLLQAEYTVHIPCSQSILQLIGTSALYNPKKMLWISADQNVHSYNVTWKKSTLDSWLAQEVTEQEPWLQEALFFSTKTDALFLYFSPETRTCTLIAQGKIIEKANAQHAFIALRTYLGYKNSLKKGDWYVPQFKNTSSKQTFS